jgi:hypothetical protein
MAEKITAPRQPGGGPIVGLLVFLVVGGIVGYDVFVKGETRPNDGKEKLPSASQLAGKVTAISGSAPKVSAGDPCTVAVTPSEESSRARGYNCRVKVTCGATILYGTEGGGTTRCQLRKGVLAAARDTQGSEEHDDPMLELDLERRLVVVSDNGKGWYSIAIALSAE